MKILSNIENLKFGPLFEIVHHNQCSPLLADAMTQQIPWDEGGVIVNEVFEHPSLDLALLFDQRRKHGDTPSSNEIHELQNFLQECKDDIKALKSTLSDTISTISRLSRELSETSYRLARRFDQVNLSEYLLSAQQNSMELLPQDVLEQVFLACLHSRDSYTPSPTYSSLQLASVCHRWRMIAHSMPKLWEDIYTNKATPDPPYLLYKAWIQRCPSYLLTIRSSNMTQDMSALLDFLPTSPSKLRLLDITFEEKEIWPRVLQADLSELQQLVFTTRHPHVELPQSAYALKRLYMHRIPISWDNNPPPSQLTVLSITSGIHCSMLEHILTHCPALECFLITIEECGPRYSGWPIQADSLATPRIVTLHHLQAFCFINDYTDANLPINLLRTFSFPALTGFEYYADNSVHKLSLPWLTSLDFIHHIHRLTLHIPDFTAAILTPILSATICLEEISIGCNLTFLKDIIGVFSSLRGSSTMVPHLQGIQLCSMCLISDLERYNSSFIGLIQSLSEPVEGRPQRLTHLNIGSWFAIGESDGEFRSLLSTYKDINLKIYKAPSALWLYKLPLGFHMYVPPFNEIQERDILQLDGSWKKEFGPVYRIVR
ncbi:hypothetical protein BDN72DRAFT_963667 [Pluteus cervinus]|uniref:Uncharacterized protein n=1 Tax=Pluteus cervinus TaxID=181527 RepID=A0ACD3AE00_9AGAR|nr:hypothetical protein BDN72DRAFT_963667 [Pluteus cervinus]